MKIVNHRMPEIWFDESRDVGGPLTDLRFIVLHYTAGGSGVGSRDYMMKSPGEKQRLLGRGKKVYGSAHLVVERDGEAWQIVPFNLKARHAGASRWKGLTSLNQYSIGIEIANYGWLNQQGDGRFRRPGTPSFNPDQVTVGPMPGSSEIKGWENYPDPQLDGVEKLVCTLIDHYPSITEILGHQEIAPGRKFDPGPAFPMSRFRNLLDNRGSGALDNEPQEGDSLIECYLTTARLNIREGPGTDYEKLPESPLATGTRLIRQEESGSWMMVCLEKEEAVQGWVHKSYLKLA